MRGKSLPPKQSAPDSLKTKVDPPKSSRHDEIMGSSNMMLTDSSNDTTALNKTIALISPSSVVVAANDVQDGASKTGMSSDSTTQDGTVNLSSKITSGSPKVTSVSCRTESDSTVDSPQPQAINSPIPTEDTSDSSEGDHFKSSDLKFISTHSRIKRTPVPSERLVPLVTNMKCRRNLIRSNGKCDYETTQPKIKRVRIVLSPLTKKDYMCHLKLAANEPGKATTSPVQQKESPHKESGSVLHSSSDKDSISDIKTYMVPRIQRKAPQTRYTSFLEDRRKHLQNNQEQLHTPESENSAIVIRTKRKRKSVPPVRYAPFAGVNPRSYNRERSDTPDSESVVSESVTSSIGSDPPLVNLHT